MPYLTSPRHAWPGHATPHPTQPSYLHISKHIYIINKDPQILLRDTMRRIVEDAGKWIGLGDYRPEFGLFSVEEFKVVEEE